VDIVDMEGWGMWEWESGPPSFVRLSYLLSTSTVHSFWLRDWAILRVSYYTRIERNKTKLLRLEGHQQMAYS